MSENRLTTERVVVPWEEAVKRLCIIPDYDPGGDGGPRPCVHTYLGGIGAHWPLSDLQELASEYGIEESGPQAVRMGHGLVICRPNQSPLFLETLS